MAILELLGFVVETIRGCSTPAEREAALGKFTDPAQKCDAFVLNGSTMFTGLNIHPCYCRGIIIQSPNSEAVKEQIVGRLPRKGQKYPVEWVVIMMRDSYDAPLELRRLKKYLPQARVDNLVPEHIKTAELKNLVACEIMKIRWSLPFNRYPWVCYSPANICEWTNQWYQDLGDLSSLIAKILCERPSEEYTEDFMQRLAWGLSRLLNEWTQAKDRGDFNFADVNLESIMAWIDQQEITAEEQCFLDGAQDEFDVDRNAQPFKREKRKARRPQSTNNGKDKASIEDETSDHEYEEDDSHELVHVNELANDPGGKAAVAMAALKHKSVSGADAFEKQRAFNRDMNRTAKKYLQRTASLLPETALGKKLFPADETNDKTQDAESNSHDESSSDSERDMDGSEDDEVE